MLGQWKDSYSIPRIEGLIDRLNCAVLFTVLDLKVDYWQVKMDEKPKPLTAFTVSPLSFDKCDCMPFSLVNAAATFQRLLETCSCLDKLQLN